MFPKLGRLAVGHWHSFVTSFQQPQIISAMRFLITSTPSSLVTSFSQTARRAVAIVALAVPLAALAGFPAPGAARCRAPPRNFAARRAGVEVDRRGWVRRGWVRLVVYAAFTLDAGAAAGDTQVALPFAARIGYSTAQRRSRLGLSGPID